MERRMQTEREYAIRPWVLKSFTMWRAKPGPSTLDRVGRRTPRAGKLLRAQEDREHEIGEDAGLARAVEDADLPDLHIDCLLDPVREDVVQRQVEAA